MFKTKSYSFNNLTLIDEFLRIYINGFWDEIFSNIVKNENKHLMLMRKVEFSDLNLGYRTLGQLRRVNFDDKELYINYLSEILYNIELLELDDYSHINEPLSKITFSYIIKDGLAPEKRALLQDIKNKK
jgi:hypothetical protein